MYQEMSHITKQKVKHKKEANATFVPENTFTP